MKQQSFSFDGIEELDVIPKELDSSLTLIQVFLNTVDISFIQELQQFFQKNFPKSILIGTTSDGVVDGKRHYDALNIVTFLEFEKTQISYLFLEHKTPNACFDTGKYLAQELLREDTKVIICFADGLNTNGEELINGIANVDESVVVAGGMAADNGKMVQTFVFDKENLTSKGVVAAALHNKDLYAYNAYSFDWTPIGKELTVNKVVKNRVYEMDGMRAVDVYAKYFGNEIANELPKTGIEFPLIFKKDGITVGRAVLVKHDDGSLTYAGNIQEGSKIRFGVGNIDLIIRDLRYKIDKMLHDLDFQPEAIFTYSCMARKYFLQSYVDMELEILSRLGYISGFYTYGEFFHAEHSNQFLNETMTLLVLSENKRPLTIKSFLERESLVQPKVRTVHALANLANVVSKELELLNKNLEKKVEESTRFIYKQAYFDKLTGLPNRVSLIKRLEHSSNEVIVLINIDDFTSINDFYGHLIGDKVLQFLAKLLQEFIKNKPAELYKLPSDEFAIIVHQQLNYQEIEQLLQELLSTIEKTVFQIENITLYISVSLSAALTNSSGSGLANADMVLKHAKKTSQSYMIYRDDIEMLERYQDKLSMATELKEAIEEDRIVPFYQPIYDAKTNQVVKYEALVRLEKKDGSIISPYFFLELSQKIKLYPKITQKMIDKTFAFFAENKKEFSINLAFDDILNEITREYLFEQIKRYDIAQQLTVEILETQEINKENNILAFLDKLHRCGVKIAIDDFGSGFANFEYLAKIDADFIKIDGSLIKNIDHNTHARVVAETIVEFAKKLGKQTIAEFVHSKEVYEAVQKLGVDYVQGYYLAQPLATLAL